MPEIAPAPANNMAGTLGFLVGGIAFLLVLTAVVAGPFAPQQNIGVSIGETAGESGKAMIRNWLGMAQPVPQAQSWDIDRALWLVSILVGGLAIILGLLTLLRAECRMLAGSAILFGGAAATIQRVAGALMLILGTILLCAILATIAAFFEGFSFF